MHQPTYEYIEQQINDHLSSKVPGPKRDALEKQFKDISERYNELKRSADKRHRQLNVLLPLARKYHDAQRNVERVVVRAETELGSLEKGNVDVEKGRQDLQNLKVSGRTWTESRTTKRTNCPDVLFGLRD